jgi:Cohesin domain/FlgD Ig-like domain/Dockerin type I domain
VTLSGTIKHPNLVSFIPGVTVALAGPTSSSVVTVANGQYSLTANTGGSYTVTPSKANDVTLANGMTTLDILLIQRHILLADTLDSPYKIIAADVNSSGGVSGIDIVLIRNMILQNSTTFPLGRLWAMVDASHVFPDSYLPFPFPSTLTYPSAGNASNQDFIGIKLGDVSWDWNPTVPKVDYLGETGVSFGKTSGRVGELVTIPVRVEDFDQLAGYQYTIEWDASVLEYVGVEAGAHLPGVGDSRASEGLLNISWNDEQGGVVTLPDGSVAYKLQFRVVGESGMSAQLKATSSVINGEAYDADLAHLAIVSREGGFEVVGDGGAMSAGDGIQVYQNFPNPFSSETTVRFELPETKQVRLTLSDLSGRVLLTENGLYEAGTHEWKWNGKTEGGGDLPSGTYLLRVQAGDATRTIRMVYARD